MAVRNSKLIDPEKGVFSVLDLVTVQPPGTYMWHSEDINEEPIRGAIFRAYISNKPDSQNKER